MLRVHFSHADPARIWIAAVPDTLWDIASSQHRLMSRKGRRATATLRELAIGALRLTGYDTIATGLRKHSRYATRS
ncbi:hypothetical protein [Streptomyces sp. NPDC047525]|uniref:hypothetical protein n=1 Tax=Streptomyces sp. NPDC047525 TaxID=3155264 RepID=UPI00340E2543